MKRIIRDDAVTNTKTTIQQEADGSSVFETTQNFDTLVKLNRQMAGEYRAGQMIGDTQRHMQHVAEIPLVVYNHLMEALGNPRENAKAWKAWLNDPENRDFRTGGGRI